MCPPHGDQTTNSRKTIGDQTNASNSIMGNMPKENGWYLVTLRLVI